MSHGDHKYATFFLSTGRCGTQWCAAALRRSFGDLVLAAHEPLGFAYESRDLMAGTPIEELETAGLVNQHIAQIEAVLAGERGCERKDYIETGWPSYGAIPLLAERLEGRIRLVHLTRHPVTTASSLATHGIYDRRRIDILRSALRTPFDPNISVNLGVTRAQWEAMPIFEKCLFHWGELNKNALDLKSRYPLVP